MLVWVSVLDCVRVFEVNRGLKIDFLEMLLNIASKMTILSSFSHSHVFLSLYVFLMWNSLLRSHSVGSESGNDL